MLIILFNYLEIEIKNCSVALWKNIETLGRRRVEIHLKLPSAINIIKLFEATELEKRKRVRKSDK